MRKQKFKTGKRLKPEDLIVLPRFGREPMQVAKVVAVGACLIVKVLSRIREDDDGFREVPGDVRYEVLP